MYVHTNADRLIPILACVETPLYRDMIYKYFAKKFCTESLEFIDAVLVGGLHTCVLPFAASIASRALPAPTSLN